MTLRRRPDGGKADRSQRQAAAEQLAIAALGFIAAEPERLGRFLAMTGIGPESIRDAAREPHFLAGVLDHVAGDERLLIAFAAESGIDPDAVMRARDMLVGHWARDVP
jgi:Protein of unknown function (DUF3572)